MAMRCRCPPLHASFPDDRIVAARKLVDELASVGDLGGVPNLIVGGVAPAVADVRGNRPVEEKDVLLDDAD